MLRLTTLLFTTIFFILGCSTTNSGYLKNANNPVKWNLDGLEAAHTVKNYSRIAFSISEALTKTGGYVAVNKLFKDNPVIKSELANYLNTKITTIKNKKELFRLKEYLSIYNEYKIFENEKILELQSTLLAKTKKLKAIEQQLTLLSQAKSWSNVEWNTISISDIQTKINAGADVNATIGIYNSSPLQMAVIYSENLEVIKFLIANGADVKYKNKNNATVVYFSVVFNKNPAITTLLIDNGADVNIKDNNNVSALSYAAEKSQPLEIINILIAAGANVNSRDVDGETPLHDAVLKYKDTQVIAALISAGSDINAKTNNGESVLLWGIESNNLEIVKFLVAKGADINAITRGESILHLSILANLTMSVVSQKTNKNTDIDLKSNIDIVKFLISNGANIANIDAKLNISDIFKNGENLLYLATKVGNLEMVKLLVENGANINAKMDNGETPLYLAIQEENSEIISLMSSYGVNISANKIYLYAGKLARKEVLRYSNAITSNFNHISNKVKYASDYMELATSLFRSRIAKVKKIYQYIIKNFPDDDLAIKANDYLISLNEQEWRITQQLQQKINTLSSEYQQNDLRRQKERELQKLIRLQEEAKQQREKDLQNAERIRLQDIKNAENKRKKDLQQRKNACIISHNQCVKRCRRHQNYQRENSCNNNCYQIAKSSGCT